MEAIDTKVKNYPLYLSTFFHPVFSKTILIGINQNFEVKILVLNSKKSLFLEISKDTFIKFLILLDELICHLENGTSPNKNFLHIGDAINVKFVGKQNWKLSIYDSVREISICFSLEEAKKIIDLRDLLYLDITKLLCNTNAAFNVYSEYCRIAIEKNCTKLTSYDFPSTQPLFNCIDFHRLFIEIYSTFGESKIRRDCESLGINKILNTFL